MQDKSIAIKTAATPSALLPFRSLPPPLLKWTSTKTGEPESRILVIAEGHFNQARRMQPNEFKITAVAQIGSLAETYCGADVTSNLNRRVFLECVKLFRQKFGEMGIVEIHEAFSLAAAKKINADLTAYGGKFTAAMFGNVLSAYRIYRNAILHKMTEGNDVLQQEAENQKRIERNAEYRLHVLAEFARLKSNNARIAEPDKIPLGWLRILSEEGLLERDSDLWLRTKIDVRQEFMAHALNGRPDITIGDIRTCRRIANRIKEQPDYFPGELHQRAVNLYGRRLIFSKIAPFIPEDDTPKTNFPHF